MKNQNNSQQDSYKLRGTGDSRVTNNLSGKFGTQSNTVTCVCEHRAKGPGESCERIVPETQVDVENGIVVHHNISHTYAATACDCEQTKSIRDTETPPESCPHIIQRSQSKGAI